MLPALPPAPVTKSDCSSGCVYVRAGANGSGTSWANALPRLPARLERGRTYLIATGSYPGRTFNDPTRGSSVITIKRATEADHGTNVGWSSAYGNGRTVFGPLSFTSGSYVLEGGTARSLVVRGGFREGAIGVRAGANRVAIRNVDMDGAFAQTNGVHTDGACNVFSAKGVDDLVLEGNIIHDGADDGIAAVDLERALLRNNEVRGLHACGTDGAGCRGECFNGHSDSIELWNVKHSVIEGNFFSHHSKTTAALFMIQPQSPGDMRRNENLDIRNNIFYTPNTGIVAYFHNAHNLRVHNNTFWGVRKGRYGGVHFGQRLTNFSFQNNIVLSFTARLNGGTRFELDPNTHRVKNNLLAIDNGEASSFDATNFFANPRFADSNSRLGAFELRDDSPAVNRGVGGAGVPGTDMLKRQRLGAPDLGALERR